VSFPWVVVVKTPRGRRWWEVWRLETGELVCRLVPGVDVKRRGRNKVRELRDEGAAGYSFQAVAAGYVVRARFTGDAAKLIRSYAERDLS